MTWEELFRAIVAFGATAAIAFGLLTLRLRRHRAHIVCLSASYMGLLVAVLLRMYLQQVPIPWLVIYTICIILGITGLVLLKVEQRDIRS